MTNDTENADLSKWGAGSENSPPRVERKSIRRSPTTKKIAGFVGHDHVRGCKAYTTLRGPTHYYENGGGYAISASIIDTLQSLNVARVYIHTTDRGPHGIENGDVQEYWARDYYQGDSIPERDLEDPDDPQQYAPEDARIHDWPGLGTDLYVREFEDALDFITARSRGGRWGQ